MNLKTLPLTDIKPYWRNPRNNEGAVAAVRQSIEDYGFNVPLVIDTDNTIIAGHTRYKALRQLGREEVPCVILDIDAKKAKEYRIADNKTNELTSWDYSNLIPELRELDAERMEAYFPNEDLEGLLSDAAGVTHYNPVTQERVDERESALATTFEDRNRAEMGQFIPLMCPECGAEHSVKLDDVLRRSQDERWE